MKLKNLFLASFIIFFSLSIFTLFVEYVFPYSFFENYNFKSIFNLENYFIQSIIGYFFITISIFFLFKNNKIKIDLYFNDNFKLKKIYSIIIIGIFAFVYSKVFLLEKINNLQISSLCELRYIRPVWLLSGGIEQNILYKIISPVGMLLVNAYVIPLFFLFLKKNRNLKFILVNYIFVIFPVLTVFFILTSKNSLINLMVFTLIFSLFSFFKNNSIKFFDISFVFVICASLIFYSFYIRSYCEEEYAGSPVTNSEFVNDSVKNFNNISYLKEKSDLNFINNSRQFLIEKPSVNYFFYYISHSKMNSDFYFLHVNDNRDINHWYLKVILRYLSRGILFEDFGLSKNLQESYQIKKIRGGINLSFYMWHDYKIFGIILFNFIFLIFLILNEKLSKKFKKINKFQSSFNFVIITTYLHNVFFSNLFIGFVVFNSIFAYFLLFIFLLVYNQNDKCNIN